MAENDVVDLVNSHLAELPQLQPKRLYRQIADLIVARIRSGVFLPGSTLPSERDLALQLGVSRPSVREALIALEVSGLVEIRMGSGVYVRDVREEVDLDDAGHENSPVEQLQVRSLIEGESAAMAAMNATPAQVGHLDAATQAMASTLDDMSAFHGHDHDFHLRVAEATGNQALVDLVEYLWRQRYSPMYRKYEEHYAGSLARSAMLDDHRAVLEAIRAGDPQRARQFMKEHLEHVREQFIR